MKLALKRAVAVKKLRRANGGSEKNRSGEADSLRKYAELKMALRSAVVVTESHRTFGSEKNRYKLNATTPMIGKLKARGNLLGWLPK